MFLHISALSDEEYLVYTSALRDVLDIDQADAKLGKYGEEEELLEGMEVGVREVRAWMKGRYRDVQGADIDKVSKAFFHICAKGTYFTSMYGRFFTYSLQISVQRIS